MRKIIIFLLLASTINACKTAVKKENTILLVEINNTDAKTIKLQNFSRNFQKEIPLSKNNTFVDTIKKTFNYYFFKIANREISCYLPKGSNVKITGNAKDIANTIKFEGENATINTYLFTKDSSKKILANKEEELFALPEKEFLIQLKKNKSILEEKANQAKLPTSFLTQELRNIHFGYLLDITRYQEYHQYYTKNILFKVSDSYPLTKEVASFNFDNVKDYHSSRAYKYVRHRFFTRLANKKQKETKEDFGVALIDVVDAHMKNTKMKDEYLFQNLQGLLGGHVDNLKGIYHKFMSVSTNDAHKKIITNIYNNLKALDKGNPSPKFVNYLNYAGGTTSLDDFKGKYVYIDIWATWCGPCKREIPYLQKLEKKYHSKNIQFISISIDREKAKTQWRKMIQEKKMTGVQLFADNAFKSSFIKKYAINSIPRFILLDPKGNIVDANVARPSNPKLIRIFNSLGIK